MVKTCKDEEFCGSVGTAFLMLMSGVEKQLHNSTTITLTFGRPPRKSPEGYRVQEGDLVVKVNGVAATWQE